jgi:hypothetical protein
LSVKVKVLGSGLCAYGWVTILLYSLRLNEHNYYSNRLEMLDAITCGPIVSLIYEKFGWLRGRATGEFSPRLRWERDISKN